MTSEPSPQPTSSRFRFEHWLEVALIWLVFFCHAGWPAPDDNEAHYLAKARHYWDPNWLAGDPFLESADSHVAFYFLGGWPTLFYSFPVVAWLGRSVTWALLAWSWARLSRAVAPRFGFAVLSAALYVFFTAYFHMAGEWVVGGYEAKGFAYVFVFLAAERLVRGQWNTALALLGAASALHVLVGGWSAVALGFAWLLSRDERPRLKALAPGVVVALALASFGLAPALMLTRGVEPEVVAEANRIYVFERLPHHLWIFDFPPKNIIRHVLLIAFAGALSVATPLGAGEKRLRRFVGGAVAISVIGALGSAVLANSPTAAAACARYYWFRLSDALAPMGGALAVIAYVAYLRRWRPQLGAAIGVAALVIGLGYAAYGVRYHVLSPFARTERLGKVVDVDDWIAACDFVRENTPRDARFLTPRRNQSFHWRAERSEVVTAKNIPQEAQAIVDWRRAIHDIYGTGLEPPADKWRSLSEAAPEEIIRLSERYDATYMLTEANPPAPFEMLYRNDSYAVYRIR